MSQFVPRGPGYVRSLRALVVSGVASLAFYFHWWSEQGRLVHPGLSVLLLLAALYTLAQVLAAWLLYLRARRPAAPPPPSGALTVDVFLTACGEPHALVERALTACRDIRGPHRTWLLDDGDDPALEQMARRLDVGYLTRPGNADRKAGNVNAALRRTSGDVVALFDVDHAPRPEFLDRTLGHFENEDIGFVQSMLTHSNEDASWVARAASESTYDFYNPTCLGADAVGGTTHVGTNGLLRRAALDSIGGYRPGLAEDLATSLALHEAGWKSAYVAEPLAPGLAPVDVPAWYAQQLKWSRGVFEVLLTRFVPALPRLTWGQRLCYLVRCTYYLLGIVVAIHVAFMVAVLLLGRLVARTDFADYLLHILPVGLSVVLVRSTALLAWRHPAVPRRTLWRAMCLVFGTWPVYGVSGVLALLRVPVRFRPTPKGPGGRLGSTWMVLQAGALGTLSFAVVWSLTHRPETPRVLYIFAAMQLVPMSIVFLLSARSWRRRGQSPEEGVRPVTSYSSTS